MRPLIRAPLAVVAVLLVAAVSVPVAATPATPDPEFILFRGGDDTIMSGNLTDLRRIKKTLRRHERALWFRAVDGREMLVRDAQIVAAVEAAWRGAHALGEQIGAIGTRQGAIGTQRGKLGAMQGTLGAEQGSLSLELTTASPTRRTAIEKRLREIAEAMRALEAKSEALEAPLRELEKQMAVLDNKLEEAVHKARVESVAIFARAVATGAAKPL